MSLQPNCHFSFVLSAPNSLTCYAIKAYTDWLGICQCFINAYLSLGSLCAWRERAVGYPASMQVQQWLCWGIPISCGLALGLNISLGWWFWRGALPTPTQALALLTGMGFLLRHADILVGAAITASLTLLVAAGALCRAKWRRRHPGRALGPEEPPEQAVEEPPVMELQDLGDCLRLDPFQLKLRARPPEWLWGARAHPGQAYRVFLEQSPPL